MELEKQTADEDDQQADEDDSWHGAPDDHPSLINSSWSKDDIIDHSHNTKLNVSRVELTELVWASYSAHDKNSLDTYIILA